MSKKFLAGAVGTALSAWMLSNTALAALPGAQLRQYVGAAQKDVIVVLRDQMSSLPPLRRAMGARASALMGAQRRVLAGMPQLQNRRLKHFATINAFATSLTASEVTALAGNPEVQAVFNDTVITLPKATERNAAAAASAAAANANCNTLEPEALQLTKSAFLDTSVPQAQTIRDGNGHPVTGKGVKVAFIADGIDTSIKGFVHEDGTPVFVDVQDFTGDPAGTPTGGGEAFIDSSAIAANDMPNGKVLKYDLSTFVNPAHPLPKGCEIRVRGIAPGASLVGLKGFGANGATTSALVQAIEYAVTQADVDVINESFGGNAQPSLPDSPIDLANEAAVRAGVVVTVSTGDAGTNGTLGEEAERSAIIAVGATTAFRLYAQTGDGIMPLLKKPGYVSNNISAISSGGVAQGAPKVLDVVAPGDLGWSLCSTNVTLFQDCLDNTVPGNPAPIFEGGGTSQSSPFTAGVAALVIQAYRSVHRGQDPSPALVKSIIMSTATDLGAPPSEQGAGLVNAYAAVNAALSVGASRANLRGSGLLVSPNSAGAEAQPDTDQVRTFLVTNTGNTVKHLAPTLEALGTKLAGERVTLISNPASDPTFVNAFGNKRSYITRSFKVPANAEHLDAAIAFKSTLEGLATNPPLVFLALIDPAGRQAAYSIPQGLGSGYAHVDVVDPQAGNWTAVVYTRVAGVDASYAGKVRFSWRADKYNKIGNVYPAKLDLAPGASSYLRVQFSMPSAAGDLSAAVHFDTHGGADAFPAIPVTLRSLVALNKNGGSFEGNITGSNARPQAGPTQSFAFDVPPGHSDIALTLKVSDPNYLLQGVLVDPQGMQLSVAPNLDPVDGSTLDVLDLHHYNPQPGRWHFLLLDNLLSSGNQTELPFSAQIKFDGAKISAPGLPDDARVKLSASKPVTVAIKVRNNTPMRQLYFADARLPSTSITQLPDQECSKVTTLPGACGSWLLPTQSNGAAFLAQSNQPIQMDASNVNGYLYGITFSPDVWAKPVAANTVAAVILQPEVPYSYWQAVPSLIGPYKAAGSPTAPVTIAAFAFTKDFDPAVAADSGDLWADVVQNTNTFNPLVLDPGQSGVINLTITPDATRIGDTVSGAIYVDTWNPNVTYGDEVVRLPYRYTIAQ